MLVYIGVCVCVVLLQLKDLFRSSPVQPAETETQKNDPDPSHLSDRTPTPTSLEVRDGERTRRRDAEQNDKEG